MFNNDYYSFTPKILIKINDFLIKWGKNIIGKYIHDLILKTALLQNFLPDVAFRSGSVRIKNSFRYFPYPYETNTIGYMVHGFLIIKY